jgi:hypothetical protein
MPVYNKKLDMKMQLKKKSTTKKYNIMDISEIKFSISKNKNITYWAKVNYD